MFRLLLKLVGGGILIFVLPIVLISAQSYDDGALRTFLAPPAGCPAPCFMGIRPGVTTFNQAATIVQTHEWVAQTNTTQQYRNRYRYLFWQWNDSQSFLPSAGFDNSLTAGIETSGDLSIQTNIALVELWWLYGAPHWMQHLTLDTGREQYLFGYPEHKMIVNIDVPHCTKLFNVLTTNSEISFMNWVSGSPERSTFDFDVDLEMVDFRNINPCARS